MWCTSHSIQICVIVYSISVYYLTDTVLVILMISACFSAYQMIYCTLWAEVCSFRFTFSAQFSIICAEIGCMCTIFINSGTYSFYYCTLLLFMCSFGNIFSFELNIGWWWKDIECFMRFIGLVFVSCFDFWIFRTKRVFEFLNWSEFLVLWESSESFSDSVFVNTDIFIFEFSWSEKVLSSGGS